MATEQRQLSIEESLGLAASLGLERLRESCQLDANAFSEFVLRDETGERMRQAPIHRVMHLHVEACWKAGLHAAVIAPFGHGKTNQLIVGGVARELGSNPNLRTKIICANDDRAMERAIAIRNVMDSDPYRFVFPNIRFVDEARASRSSDQAIRRNGPSKSLERRKKGKKFRDSIHMMFLERAGFAIDASIHAAGVTTGGTGGRCDRLYFDDVVDFRNALENPAMRPKVVHAIENVWLQRLEPFGHALFLGTPWHEADAVHHIQKIAGWCTLKIQVARNLSRLEMFVVNPPGDYPLPRAVEPRVRRAA